MKRFLGVVVMAVVLSGCAGWQAFTTCVKGQSAKDVQATIAAVIAIASSPAGYVSALLQLGKEVGPGTVDCIAQALVADTAKHPSLQAMFKHLDEYLKARMAMGVVPTCEPQFAALIK